MYWVIWLLGIAGLWGQMPKGDAAVEAGRQTYLGACSGCHGATGEGSQGPSLLGGRVTRLADRALFGVIKNGLPGTSMPEFPIGDEKVWQVTAYVRSLAAPAAAVAVRGDAEKGRAYYFGAGGCAGCHMIRGEGGYPGPDLSNVGATRTVQQLRESIARPGARVAEGYRPVKAVVRGGRTVAGVAKNYNNYSAQVVDRTGRLHLLERGSLESFDVGEGSLMPAVGDGGTVTDLVAFLARQTTRPVEGAGR